jgi:hypothetical protein
MTVVMRAACRIVELERDCVEPDGGADVAAEPEPNSEGRYFLRGSSAGFK